MRNQDDHSAEQSANILLLTEVQSCNNYRAKHADRIFLKYIELQNALEQNDLQEVQRLSNEMMEHCREIAIDSEVICDTVIERLSLLSLPNRSDKKNIRLPKSIVQVSAERANEKYSDWADSKSIQPNKQTRVSLHLAHASTFSSHIATHTALNRQGGRKGGTDKARRADQPCEEGSRENNIQAEQLRNLSKK